MIQAVSCDEALLDITGLVRKMMLAVKQRRNNNNNNNNKLDAAHVVERVAAAMRKDIFDSTGCNASAGIGGNILLARLATKKAKPNGQCYIAPSSVASFLATLQVGQLPGVGRKLERKLSALEGVVLNKTEGNTPPTTTRLDKPHTLS